MTSVIRTRRGGRQWAPPLQRKAARGRKVEGPLGVWAKRAQGALTWSEITWGEGFDFRNRPS